MQDPDDDRCLLDELFGADDPEDAQDVDVEDVAAAGGTDDDATAEARGVSRWVGNGSGPDRRRQVARRPGEPASRSPSSDQTIETSDPGAPVTGASTTGASTTGASTTGGPSTGALTTGGPGMGRTARPRSALSESGLPQAASPASGRRSPAWREAVWERAGTRPSAAPGCREIGLTTTGFVIFVMVDSIMMYTPFSTPGSTSLLPQALTLLLLAFGLGGLMVWSIRGASRPVGFGMMLGWVFMTLVSAGYFTGLNP